MENCKMELESMKSLLYEIIFHVVSWSKNEFKAPLCKVAVSILSTLL